MTIPNVLTLIRILLTPLLVWLLINQELSRALLVFFIAGVTDGLDGFIARAFNQKSKLGAYLDPLADKLLLDSSFILLARLGLVPVWLAIITITRDALILLGIVLFFLNHISVEIKPSIASKLTTLCQIITALVAMSSTLWHPHSVLLTILFIMTALFTIVSGFHYIYKAFRIWEAGPSEN